MSFDPIAQSLAWLNRFSQADWVHKLGIFEPAQKVAYVGAREGFKAASAAARQFKSVQKLLKPERLPAQEKKADVFDLNPTEEQQMLRDMTQRFAREAMRPAAHDSDAKAAPVEGFDAQFAELGLAQFAVPEALGGAASEAWETTQCLAAEDLGHGDMGLAVRALAPVGVANALARWGTSEQQDKYLRAFASDKPPLASIAICERRVAFDAKELTTRALVNGEGYILNGEKTLVPLADEADLYLVAAQLVGHGPCVFIVEANTPGLTRMHESTMGVRAARTGAIKLEDVKLPADALLGGELGVVNYEELVDRAQLAWCALAIGAGQAVLEYTIEYCNDRVAFGEPISNRQAVAFMIANIGIEVESMRLLTWRAAARAEAGLPFHREAYLAHLLCLEKGMEIGTNGVQLLGGHGFTKEHPVERWYRDLMALGVMEGGLCL